MQTKLTSFQKKDRLAKKLAAKYNKDINQFDDLYQQAWLNMLENKPQHFNSELAKLHVDDRLARYVNKEKRYIKSNLPKHNPPTDLNLEAQYDLRKLLPSLIEDQKKLIRLFLANYSAQEISKELNLSIEQSTHLLDKTFYYLRNFLNAP